MSTPSVPNNTQQAMNELISAMSALNMYPDPIPGATGYISETDKWVKHAMEHLQALAQYLHSINH